MIDIHETWVIATVTREWHEVYDEKRTNAQKEKKQKKHYLCDL